ncbi:MAG TPA: PfkB family carbohydrate kinase, partial [Capsulimonadaceae bacterium]|nr:PfkB family carbohydrate kinase [Capsulimonadaceae bacterium]
MPTEMSARKGHASMAPKQPYVLCFGEVLWDCVPRGLFLGGAPANVAYHLTRNGCRAALVSAIGNDFLGDEILRRVKEWGVDTQLITRVREKQTGVVLVDLSDPSHPSYDIVRDVAWDHISGSPELRQAVKMADALVFGTLAQRTAGNRALLEELLLEAGGLKVFDVNFRPPFIDLDLALALGRRSDLIKLNEDELGQLLPDAANESLLERAEKLAARTGCQKVCVTCGEKGAGLLIDGRWHWADSLPTEVKDTIGAGDAFLAALTAGLLVDAQPDQILVRAARLAEFVAARDGATPEYRGLGLAHSA